METNKIPWSEIISLIIILVVGGILINEIFFSGDFLEDQPCMESICIKYSIDDLNNCKDVGFENFGFLYLILIAITLNILSFILEEAEKLYLIW